MNEKPWLILTLRRTGGTSLTSFLSAISSFPTLEHEPFNPDRELGRITQNFLEEKDSATLKDDIRAALAARSNIKHCVEVIPQEVTRCLIEVCNEMGYRFIMLTRRDEGKRLASLFLAVATGVWGPKEAEKVYPRIKSGEVIPKPIELKNVDSRVRTDFFTIGRTLSLLRNRNIDHPWYLFEELYFGDESIEDQAREIAADLGVMISKDDERLREFGAKEGQKSSEIAPFVKGYDAVVQRLKELCPV